MDSMFTSQWYDFRWIIPALKSMNNNSMVDFIFRITVLQSLKRSKIFDSPEQLLFLNQI